MKRRDFLQISAVGAALAPLLPKVAIATPARYERVMTDRGSSLRLVSQGGLIFALRNFQMECSAAGLSLADALFPWPLRAMLPPALRDCLFIDGTRIGWTYCSSNLNFVARNKSNGLSYYIADPQEWLIKYWLDWKPEKDQKWWRDQSISACRWAIDQAQP